MNLLVKCIIWDADNTVWDGILAEEGVTGLRQLSMQLLRLAREKGIINAMVSRNDISVLKGELERQGIANEFVYVLADWGNKSENVKTIVGQLDFTPETIVFIDDQAYEREEVETNCPGVKVIDPNDARAMEALSLHCGALKVSKEAMARANQYLADRKRKAAEASFTGTTTDFAATLDLKLTIRAAAEDDVARAHELLVRTSQLNATGHIYSENEIAARMRTDNERVFAIELEDRFGNYGIIGIILMDLLMDHWIIKQFVVSCRVMSRGVLGIVCSCLMRKASEAGVSLKISFCEGPRNQNMHATLRFWGFKTEAGDKQILVWSGQKAPAIPPYVTIESTVC